MARASRPRGDRDEAIVAFRESWRIESKRKQITTTAYALAESLRLAGRLDEAIGVLKEVLSIKPDESRARSDLASLLTLRGR